MKKLKSRKQDPEAIFQKDTFRRILAVSDIHGYGESRTTRSTGGLTFRPIRALSTML